jgi:hypothetical protein
VRREIQRKRLVAKIEALQPRTREAKAHANAAERARQRGDLKRARSHEVAAAIQDATQ